MSIGPSPSLLSALTGTTIAAAATLLLLQQFHAAAAAATNYPSAPGAAAMAAPMTANGSNNIGGDGGGGIVVVESLGNASSFPSPLPSEMEAAAAAEAAAIPADCQYDEPPLTAVRFWIVTIFGTSIALCSIMENAFFFYLFFTRKHHRTSFNCYMMFIALFDLLISSSYIFLMSMNVLMDFLQSLTLFRIWHYYMVPMITISHCAITAGSFLILAATIERYFLTSNSRYIRSIQRNRQWIILFAILMAILSKGSICMEFKISYREECANTMSEIDIGFADFVFDTDYHLYFRFYYRNFVTIFLPFFALLFLNFKIIHMLAKFEKENYQFQLLNSATATAKQIKRKKVTRAATVTTILVVCTYLISNIISVALTTWEHIDKTSLMSDYLQIYLISIDFTSLLTVTACAFRPLIYLICQPALRKEVFAILKGIFHINDGMGGTDAGLRRVSAFEPMYNSVEVSTPMHHPAFVIGADSMQQHRLSIPQVLRDQGGGGSKAAKSLATNNNNNNNNETTTTHLDTVPNGRPPAHTFWPHLEQFKLAEENNNNNNNNNNEIAGVQRRKALHMVDSCGSGGGGKSGQQNVRSILYTGNETLL